MPVDNWLILALIMIFSSVIFCGLLPIIIRLIIARQRYRRYRLELQEIACSSPDVMFNLQAIYHSIQIDPDETLTSNKYSVLYTQIPFIDEQTKEDDTYV